VLVRVNKRSLKSPDDLKAALESGPAPAVVWREGKEEAVRLAGLPLGVVLDQRPAAQAVRAWREADASLVLRGTGHTRLPGTRLEAEAVARLAGGKETTLLLGSSASEQELDRLAEKEGLHRYRILHFATHGEVDLERPERCRLILAQDRLPDPVEQNRQKKKVYTGELTAETVRGWKLDADLVVLSACQTGQGRKTSGDGRLGFAHAFIQAGARSVVLSRWKVEDTATALLMLRLHENLRGGRAGLKGPLGRAEALREAQAWLRTLGREEAGKLAAGLAGGTLRGTAGPALPLVKGEKPKLPEGDKPFAHPFYWAAFFLVGDPD
jgi:CHAT domain-containing protein